MSNVKDILLWAFFWWAIIPLVIVVIIFLFCDGLYMEYKGYKWGSSGYWK
jgi:hypothetical protein